MDHFCRPGRLLEVEEGSFMSKYTILLLGMCVLSLADEPVNRGCRMELIAVRFFTFLGVAPPSIKGPEDSDWNDVSKETLKKLLDMEIANLAGTANVIQWAAFATSSNKYFAELHLVYAYRFAHHHKFKTSWEIGQQNHLSNNQKDFYEVGKAGLADARAATLRAQKNIRERLNKQLKEQCKEHENN